MITEKILNDIQTFGFSVQDHFLNPQTISDLRSEIMDAYHNISTKNTLHAAGVGRNAELVETTRGDKIRWLEKENLTVAQSKVWDFLDSLKNEFNQKLFLGVKDFETHVTVYPVDTFYKKHIDQFKNSHSQKIRKISFVIYLNEVWEESYGGLLSLYDQEKVIKSIVPQGGRAVFFLSDEFPHEVSKTTKERVSMTGWFHT